MCRLGALQISVIKPLLAANGIKLVAIGLEQTGAEEFIEKKFFDGGKLKYKTHAYDIITNVEVYIDEVRQCYKDLKYKRYMIVM